MRACALALFLSVWSVAACDDTSSVPTASDCLTDYACRNGDLCDGLERCVSGRCEAASEPLDCSHLQASPCPQSCQDSLACSLQTCESGCFAPAFPTLRTVPTGFSLALSDELTVTLDGAPLAENWFTLDEPGTYTLDLAWKDKADCPTSSVELWVAEPAALREHHAIPYDDARIDQWGEEVITFTPGQHLLSPWDEPWRGLGPAQGTSTTLGFSLGEGGEVTLAFAKPVRNGPGFDIAVFENAFSALFLELAWIEVSSNGRDFVRFDSLSEQSEALGAFGTLNPDELHGLAGLHVLGIGTGFDLEALRFHPLVLTGRVDLNAIHYVRVVDVLGDGTARDSLDAPIWDPWPTRESAGFDLNGIAALGAPPGR